MSKECAKEIFEGENYDDNLDNNEDDIIIDEEDIVGVYDLADDNIGNDNIDEDGDYDDHNDDDDDNAGDSLASASKDSIGPDKAAIVFTSHNESVFCIDTDPVSPALVVTGGQDDTAYCWSIHNGHTVTKMKGTHTDSVTHVAYAADGARIATGDMSGCINVWSVTREAQGKRSDDSPQGQGGSDSAPVTITHVKTCDMELRSSGRDEGGGSDSCCIHWLLWHPTRSSVLLAGGSDDVWMWEVTSDQCRVFTHGREGASTMARILPNADGHSSKLFSGHEKGDMRCWDLKTSSTLYLIDGKSGGHGGSVSCIAVHPRAPTTPVLLTGALDGTLKLLNYATGKVMNTLKPKASGSMKAGPSETGEDNAIEDAAFSPREGQLACSVTTSGLITIWDLHTCMVRHNIEHTCCITKLLWHQHKAIIYTGDSEGRVSIWDVANGTLKETLTGHESHVLDMTLVMVPKQQTTGLTSDHTMKLVTASDDGTCRVFEITD